MAGSASADSSDAAAVVSSRLWRRYPRVAETLLVLVGSALATWVQYREMWQTLRTHLPLNPGSGYTSWDPVYYAWQLAWTAHATGSSGAPLWTSTAFMQAQDNVAYTDAVVGYAPIGWFTNIWVGAGQESAIMQLNLAVMASVTLSAASAYLLARVWGAHPLGASIAGIIFAFAPWRAAQIIHINVMSTAGIAASLALLCYGHAWSLRAGWQPHQMRPRWIVIGWTVAAWQMLFGFATGIWFAYTLAIAMGLWTVGAFVWWWRRRPSPRQFQPQKQPDAGTSDEPAAVRWRPVLVAHAVGGAVYLLVTFWMLQPFLRVVATQPGAQHTEEMIGLFSPTWRGWFLAPDTSVLWGQVIPRQPWGTWLTSWRHDPVDFRWPPEMAVSPGWLALLLAAVGLAVSVFSLRRRLVLGVACVLVAVLALGVYGPTGGRLTYLPLYHHLPGWNNLRTSGRLMIWVTLGLAVLAAGAVTWAVEKIKISLRRHNEAGRPESRSAWRVVEAVPAAVLICVIAPFTYLEGASRNQQSPVTRAAIDFSALPQPVLVLPNNNTLFDYYVMFWGTQGWPVLANGSSSFDSDAQADVRAITMGFADRHGQGNSSLWGPNPFPSVSSVSLLRQRGIQTVVVLPNVVRDSPWRATLTVSSDQLPAGVQVRTVNGVKVFSIQPSR